MPGGQLARRHRRLALSKTERLDGTHLETLEISRRWWLATLVTEEMRA
jgi:hypothetical protein